MAFPPLATLMWETVVCQKRDNVLRKSKENNTLVKIAWFTTTHFRCFVETRHKRPKQEFNRLSERNKKNNTVL